MESVIVIVTANVVFNVVGVGVGVGVGVALVLVTAAAVVAVVAVPRLPSWGLVFELVPVSEEFVAAPADDEAFWDFA